MTEKAHMLMAKGVYTFLVDKKATKKEVAAAVKDLFAVDAVWVNISPLPTKQKRIAKTRNFTTVGSGKKAIVKLKPGQTISALSPKNESKEKNTKKESREKEVVKVKVEGKEGA
jgi:ribosomal protein L23